MILSNIIDSVTRQAENIADGTAERLFEPVVRLGVTGLSRAGKTVFITSLVSNLLERGRMVQLVSVADGRLQTAYLQPQPDDTLPRFEYENHLAAMTGADPHWPQSTRAISQLRLSFRVQPQGITGAFRGAKTVHLDIIDYPGEWLLDLPLMDQTYAQWSAQSLALVETRKTHFAKFRKLLAQTDAAEKLDEQTAQKLAKTFTQYLSNSRESGYSACAPGRFLMPGDLEGSPALAFCPLPEQQAKRGSLYREFERRFEAYKSKIIKPFFKDHFARIDRQIVLIDMLGAIHHGPRAVADLRGAMVDILAAFKTGSNTWLSQLLGKKRIDRLLFAATKADHLHHTQHGNLTRIVEALVQDAKTRAEFSGATTQGMSIASLRATTQEDHTQDGALLPCVRGTLAQTGQEVAMFAGELPGDPATLLAPALAGKTKWLDAEFNVMNFLPAKNTLKHGLGVPHIRLDKATEFLIGDKLR